MCSCILNRNVRIFTGILQTPFHTATVFATVHAHPLSYRFGVIAAYCSNFGHCVFEPPVGGLGTTYDVHLRLIGKRV